MQGSSGECNTVAEVKHATARAKESANFPRTSMKIMESRVQLLEANGDILGKGKAFLADSCSMGVH